MPVHSCSCRCKMCRAPGADHCRSHPSCRAPARRPAEPASRAPSAAAIAETLRRLKASSGTHSPSVAELERALPGVVQVDACFLSNPYATAETMRRLRELDPRRLERMVSHYPSQSGAIASMLAPSVGVPADQLVVANGACEVIQALLARSPGALLLSLPTFSAYYEFAAGPVVPHRLDPARDFRLDFEELETLVERHAPDTVVVINPNNPDGGLAAHEQLVEFVVRMHGRVRQVIVDESFGAFTTLRQPRTLAPLVSELPHLVVVNSLSKSHGIAGLRLGYAVMAPLRARRIRRASLWNLNALRGVVLRAARRRRLPPRLRGRAAPLRARSPQAVRRARRAARRDDLPERGQLRAARAGPPRGARRHRAAGPAWRLRTRLRRQVGAGGRPVPARRRAQREREPAHPLRAGGRPRRARAGAVDGPRGGARTMTPAPTLPPGPRLPRALQTLRFGLDPYGLLRERPPARSATSSPCA